MSILLRAVPRCNWAARPRSTQHGLPSSRMIHHLRRRITVSPISSSAPIRSLASSALAYDEGPSEPPLLPHTIPDHFASMVSQYGDLPAVISRAPVPLEVGKSSAAIPPTTTLTYEDVDILSNRLAHSLRSMGVKKGDRVAISLGNIPEYAALKYALFKLGAIVVPLNPSFNAQQLGAALSHLGTEMLIIGAVTDLPYKPCRGRSNLDLLTTLIPSLSSPGSVKIESPVVPTLSSVIILDNTSSHPSSSFPPLSHLSPALTPYTDLISSFSSSSSKPPIPDTPLHPDEIVNIQFTSGTTSHPKAAMLSHNNLLNNASSIGTRMGLVPGDKIVVPPPLFHCFGCILGLQACLTHGSAILFPSPAFDPAASLRMVSEHSAHGLYGVATMFVSQFEMLDTPSFRDSFFPPSSSSSSSPPETNNNNPFRNLKKGIAAGSSVPKTLMNRLHSRLGLADLVICYGQTETSPVSLMTGPRDPLDKRTGSVGKAMPHVSVKITDPRDRTRVVGRGEKGELVSGGYLVMKGYYGDEERTKEDRVEEEVVVVDQEGKKKRVKVWMHSGDEAVMDEEGFVSITGRIKDLIIRGGENISPLEIENCLFTHPSVLEVSVVGVPDEKLGEAVAAFVVPGPGVRVIHDEEGKEGEKEEEGKVDLTKDEVRGWVAKHLSGHLVPKYVFWIKEYPKTASGKIQKFKLRDMAARARDTKEGKRGGMEGV